MPVTTLEGPSGVSTPALPNMKGRLWARMVSNGQLFFSLTSSSSSSTSSSSSSSSTTTATSSTGRQVTCNRCKRPFSQFFEQAKGHPEGAGYLLPPCECFKDQYRVKSSCAQCASVFDARNDKVPCSYCKTACCRNCCSLAVLQLEQPQQGQGAKGVAVNVCVHCYRVSRHIHFPSLDIFQQSKLARQAER